MWVKKLKIEFFQKMRGHVIERFFFGSIKICKSESWLESELKNKSADIFRRICTFHVGMADIKLAEF